MNEYKNISKNGVKWTFDNNYILGVDKLNKPLFAIDEEGNFISMCFDGMLITSLEKKDKINLKFIKRVIKTWLMQKFNKNIKSSTTTLSVVFLIK